MTKIFITIPWFLPAYRAGGPIQSIANLIREYTADVRYYIFTSDTDLNGAALDNLTLNEWIDFNAHTQVWYAGPEKISDSLVKQVEQIKPDVLYIVGLFSWHFNMVPLLFCKAPRKILSSRGMLHPGALSQKKWKKKLFLIAFNLLEFPYKIFFHATDAEEKKYIRKQFGNPARVLVAGNFPREIGLLPADRKEAGTLKLLSIGIISPMKNILLVLQALQHVEAVVQYDIYGPVKDEDYRDECLLQITSLPKHVSVFFHREIEPGQVPAVLQKADVFILPSKSENFGHAMYEALSAGRPIITTRDTPWINLKENHAGKNVDASELQEITRAIDFFAAMDETEFDNWRKGAVEYAAAALNKEELRNTYRRLFTENLESEFA